MIYEINKLINSEFEPIQKLGWLLYNREDQNGGLTKEEVYKLIEIFADGDFEEILEEQYLEGFKDGQENCDCEW
jgi:hypothetical protein